MLSAITPEILGLLLIMVCITILCVSIMGMGCNNWTKAACILLLVIICTTVTLIHASMERKIPKMTIMLPAEYMALNSTPQPMLGSMRGDTINIVFK